MSWRARFAFDCWLLGSLFKTFAVLCTQQRWPRVRETCSEPDNSDGLQTRCVGKQLTEVDVVGAFQLVFDQNPGVSADILAKDVGAERADRFLLSFQFQIDSESLSQDFQVFDPSEPRGEFCRLDGPDCSKINSL